MTADAWGGWCGAWATITGAADTRPYPRTGGLAELLQCLQMGAWARQKDGWSIILATFARPHRCAEAVEVTTGLGYDIDGAPPDEVRALLGRVAARGWAGLAYSSPSDGLKEPATVRARLILPLATPCPRDLHRDLYRRIGHDLSIPAEDDGCSDPARLWYGLRRAVPGRRVWVRVLEGQPVDVEPLLGEVRAKLAERERQRQIEARRREWEIRPARAVERYAAAALRRACERVAAAGEGDRHRSLIAEAAGLRRIAELTDDEIDRALSAAARTALPPERHPEIDRALAWGREHGDRRHG